MMLMTDIILFTPKAELSAAENLAGFIDVCRIQLTVFGADLRFDDDIWDITEWLNLKAKGGKRERLIFSNQVTVKAKFPTMMRCSFRLFAKAYMRYMHGVRPTKSVGSRLAALRALEWALEEQGSVPEIYRADSHIFNCAARMVGQHFSAAAAFRVGGQLEMIADFISGEKLTTVPVNWRNFLKRPADSVQVGEEFDNRRQERMPTSSVLEAIPKAFLLATEPADVIVTSVVAMLLSAPDRISEVLLLPNKCEVNIKQGNGKPDAYGIQWRPAKGGDAMIKLIVPTMSDVMKSALSRVRKCTDSARIVAAWYEKQPKKIFLPHRLEFLRDKDFLSMSELATILWVDGGSTSAAGTWCEDNKISTTLSLNRKRKFVCFQDVQAFVLSMLPSDFPFVNKEIGLRYSDALLIIRKNELHDSRGTFNCVIEGLNVDKCNERLGTGSKHGKKSVFERLGLASADGKLLEVTTHQFRHYLNTIAQTGGMSQLDIALWSGRKDISQNAVYDHRTSEQRVHQLREVLGNSGQMIGPLAEVQKYIPVKRNEFKQLIIKTAHTTDFGFCLHDYAMTPCQLHLDCINCQEHVCVKGDSIKSERARVRLAEAKLLLAKAEEAKESSYFGADRWFEHHQTTVRHLNQLCALFDDPQIKDGAYLQLAIPEMPSRLKQAEEDRTALFNNAKLLDSSETSLFKSKFDVERLRNLMIEDEENK